MSEPVEVEKKATRYSVNVRCTCENELTIEIEDGDQQIASVVGIMNNFLTNHKHQEKKNDPAF